MGSLLAVVARRAVVTYFYYGGPTSVVLDYYNLDDIQFRQRPRLKLDITIMAESRLLL